VRNSKILAIASIPKANAPCLSKNEPLGSSPCSVQDSPDSAIFLFSSAIALSCSSLRTKVELFALELVLRAPHPHATARNRTLNRAQPHAHPHATARSPARNRTLTHTQPHTLMRLQAWHGSPEGDQEVATCSGDRPGFQDGPAL